ncbi:type I restriction endonuclease subunit R [Fulvivirga sediminis]|uniref:DEAD/DEAH box helicase family protein n=1 Tax=Fulvivirga sediminis TaxID=2803949 RepID=A0A937JZ84_9BACT|nr:DEAD/DEAH box helicase family protein [Fulvivirga sediminis]MBL3657158.1 DEAD/DEAH box helicase family protein [Fulvivirga sediminis]
MSNFHFLKEEWPSVFSKMKLAEERVYSEPDSTGIKCRAVLEHCLLTIFQLERIRLPYEPTIHNLLTEPDFKAEISDRLMLDGLFYVKKIGNAAAHARLVSKDEAKNTIQYMFAFLKWFARNYSYLEPDTPDNFNWSYVPKVGAEDRRLKELKDQVLREAAAEMAEMKKRLQELEASEEAAREEAEESEAAYELLKAQNEKALAQLKAQKQERQVTVEPPFNEARTRKHLIDADLKEAGWDNLKEGRDLEFPVTGMPINSQNPKGNGFVDYVLWDDNGKPLAVIEAKRTAKQADAGRHQAFFYANCLENMYGQRPIIFYTNGYETYLWDDTFYSAQRRIYGLYDKEELQWLIQQRNTRKDIRQANINITIAGRPYQTEALQRVAENLVTDGKHGIRGARRRALLVMATGSGKTRTAAALVELLMKNNWAKRILFLADRNALVTQAKKSFNEHLPNVSAIDLTKEKENDTTRLVFSTYQSMIVRIDNAVEGEERFYGVGHFDLIILDEAHRSIYNRYQAIFDYFDALIVGLTATPKKHVDTNTYEMFGCEDEDPTFEFSLEEATPTYLCPFKVKDVGTRFLKEGVKYENLSGEEQKHYEETFAHPVTGQMPSEAYLDRATASITEEQKKWLFNKHTVNEVLDVLMTQGLKIEGGDRIGRTIIFALNQNHADFIVKCFEERYSEKPAGFISTIYNGISHVQTLIDSFCDPHKENLPQIAVSVDMMDTGIDAPRILNLVFFKPVKSYAKFWQMIGRGTRKCPNIFGPGEDKTEFLIFDICDNFEFFGENPDGIESGTVKPITQQIFESRLQLSQALLYNPSDEHMELSKVLLDILHGTIFSLNRKRFQVDMKLRYVTEFQIRDRWNNLSDNDLHIIEEHLSALPVSDEAKEATKRFDLLILKMQIANINKPTAEAFYHERLMKIAQKLSQLYGVPQVLRAKPVIEKMKHPEFYKGLTQKRMEKLRKEIRELVSLLENEDVKPVYANYQDSDLRVADIDPSNIYREGSTMYKMRVERFIRENKTNLTISKLANNKTITQAELQELEHILFDGSERGNKEDFQNVYGEQPLGNFIRSIIGLDEAAARAAFADFLQAGTLRADQMTFINQIIKYLTVNGTIDKKMLFEPPFTNVNDQGLIGVFDDGQATKIISIINQVNGNADAEDAAIGGV